MSVELSPLERLVVSRRPVAEHRASLSTRGFCLAVIGLGCLVGLAASLWGVLYSDSTWQWLVVGTTGGLVGCFSICKEWGYLGVIEKLQDRIDRLERGEDAEVVSVAGPVAD